MTPIPPGTIPAHAHAQNGCLTHSLADHYVCLLRNSQFTIFIPYFVNFSSYLSNFVSKYSFQVLLPVFNLKNYPFDASLHWD
jgi:hypothetical protein